MFEVIQFWTAALFWFVVVVVVSIKVDELEKRRK